MASSNRVSPGNGHPSPGRGFLSVDPERQREIPHDLLRPGAPDRGGVGASHSPHGVPGRPSHPAGAGRRAPAHDSDDEGGSGRRHHSA